MKGYITEIKQPKIMLKVFGKDEIKDVEFLVDTGFDGEILLSSSLVEEMFLEPIDTRLVELADGTGKTVFVSIAEIEWYGQRKEIDVLVGETTAEPLLGTELLQNSKLFIDFPNEIVKIEK